MNDTLKALRSMITGAGIDPAALSLDERRQLFESFAAPAPDGVTVSGVTMGDRPAEVLRPHGSDGRRAILYLHGGGYETGSPATVRTLAGRIARGASIDTFTLDYRLAPEHPCPAAIDDAMSAYRWLLAEGVLPSHLVVAGDSAGGGLAVALMCALRDHGDPLPAGGVLIAPWLDLTLSRPSCRTNADSDFILTLDGLTQAAAGYAGDRSLRDPAISPLYADLEGLPPLLIVTGAADLLADDSHDFAEACLRARVMAELDMWPEMPHVFVNFAGFLPEADAAIDRITSWLTQQVPSP